jgi:hypothetical protein
MTLLARLNLSKNDLPTEWRHTTIYQYTQVTPRDKQISVSQLQPYKYPGQPNCNLETALKYQPQFST